MVIKPYPSNKTIAIQYNQADSFYPLSFDSNGNITQCAFTEQFTMGKRVYTRVELHTLNENYVDVHNFAYESNNGSTIGSEISLDSVSRWSDIEPYARMEGTKKLLFGYFKVPLANTIDSDSPMGVSVFSCAAELIEIADKRYSQIDWEYDSKEAAVHIAASLLEKNKDTNEYEYPGGKKRLYRKLEYNTGAVDKPLIEEYSPDIRDASYYNGYNQQLKRIEFDCGLAYGTLSDPQNVDKTAEEIKSSKQRSYATVSDIQMALQRTLKELVAAIDYWCTIYSLAPEGEYEISFDWDDSIVKDNKEERSEDRSDVAMGARPLLEYRMKWYGEEEETAKKMLPEPDRVIE